MSYYDDWVDPGGIFRSPWPKGTASIPVDNCAKCPLCERDDIPKDLFSKHHLVPKSRGGKKGEKVPICQDCHSSIHRFFTNRELEEKLNTVESLQAEPAFAKHLAWLRKRPGRQQFKPIRRKR